MTLQPGTRIGPYQIQSALGAGGMGEVYRATDTNLKRAVAIKVLPESVAADRDRLARFQREAEVLASLNHPNIAAVYGLERSRDVTALVMELVEGPTLADRISQGPIPVDEALPIAKQIAQALEAAHEQNIIHRDLKPANIKVRKDGPVKVLDFGLAKAVDSGHLPVDASHSPTITSPALMTGAGVLLGTAAYMSPEQARAQVVDKRTDIWAFGCVLFEMLTGRQPFGAASDTVSDTIAAILRAEPDWTALSAEAPPIVQRLARRCLHKNPRERLHDIADARLELQDAQTAGPSSNDALLGTRQLVTPRIVPWLLVAAMAALAAGAVYRMQTGAERVVTRLNITMPPSVDPLTLAFSPDGRTLAFVAMNGTVPQVWTRTFDKASAVSLTGTDRATFPFWSPNGRTVAFFADAKLKRLDLDGSAAQVLADAPLPRGGTWNGDGVIVFAPLNTGALMRVSSTGGSATPVTTLGTGHSAHRWPQFLPDGQRFIFHVTASTPEIGGIYVGALDGRQPVRVADAESGAVFAAPNRLLFVRQQVLTVLPFDPERGFATGAPVALAHTVGVNPAFGRAALTVTGGSAMAYTSSSGAQLRQLTWRDRAGRIVGSVGPPDDADVPSLVLSPDGRHLATSRTTQGNQDVWLIELASGVPTRLTFTPLQDNAPTWSADGQRVIFRSARNGPYDFFEKPSNGAGDDRLLLAGPENVKIPYDVSNDGHRLLYGIVTNETGADIWALPLAGDGKPFPVVQTRDAEDSAEFSPDGRWIVYESNASGRFEVYVQAFPEPRGKWQISTAGGFYPRWHPDGKEIYYVAGDAQLMAAPFVTTADGQSVQTQVPTPLFTPQLASGASILPLGGLARALYTVSRDGRFLINEPAQPVATSDDRVFSVVLNWDVDLP